MRLRALLLITVLFIAVNAIAQSKPGVIAFKANNLYIKIGDRLQDLPGMKYLGAEGSMTYYTLPGDNKYLNKKPVNFIKYGFENNKLSAIIMDFDNSSTFMAGYELLNELLGKPYRTASEGGIHAAAWEVGDISYGIRYDNNTKTGGFVTGYTQSF
ncbi:hypothetical protein ACSX1A_17410 [Pontibacter sp. MBLB2868]|uniref:hypothetical protein n=1 Tax=Pontibacter sp. MBLB2868 TaxID=3451555 RepID=UPI003F74C5B9